MKKALYSDLELSRQYSTKILRAIREVLNRGWQVDTILVSPYLLKLFRRVDLTSSKGPPEQVRIGLTVYKVKEHSLGLESPEHWDLWLKKD
jgi:hypothetical protein